MKKDGLVHLARTPKEIKTSDSPIAVGSREKYGYGTSITLDAEALKKLGITTLPTVGDEYSITTVGKVTAVNQSASENNSSTRLEIQLTHMLLTHENEAKEKNDSASEEKGEVLGTPGMRFK